MPIFEYECETCNFEIEVITQVVATSPISTVCPTCQISLVKKWSLPTFLREPSAPPMTYFVRSDGRISIPVDSSKPTPPGYMRVEAKGLKEREHVRNQIADKAKRDQQAKDVADDLLYEARKKAQFDNIKANLSKFDYATQQTMKANMEHINKRGRTKKKKATEFELKTSLTKNDL